MHQKNDKGECRWEILTRTCGYINNSITDSTSQCTGEWKRKYTLHLEISKKKGEVDI